MHAQPKKNLHFSQNVFAVAIGKKVGRDTHREHTLKKYARRERERERERKHFFSQKRIAVVRGQGIHSLSTESLNHH